MSKSIFLTNRKGEAAREQGEPVRWGASALGGSADLKHLASASPT
ncbi:hypothetical protein [Nostoc sp.]